MYEIEYEPLDSFGGELVVESINTTGPVLMMTLTGLEEYVEYNITVRAYTSEGPGPYSDPPVTERTLEDGNKVPSYLSLITNCPTLFSQCLPLHHKMSQWITSHPLLSHCPG